MNKLKVLRVVTKNLVRAAGFSAVELGRADDVDHPVQLYGVSVVRCVVEVIRRCHDGICDVCYSFVAR